MAHETSTPQKNNPGSFLVKLEADATSMDCVPQTSQPTSDAPHELTKAEFMKSEPFEAQNGPIEMADDRDPLLKEMERITKMREEVFKTYQEKRMQLQSDYIKEYEMLREKYDKMLQDVDTAIALEFVEELVRLRNMHETAFMAMQNE